MRRLCGDLFFLDTFIHWMVGTSYLSDLTQYDSLSSALKLLCIDHISVNLGQARKLQKPLCLQHASFTVFKAPEEVGYYRN